MSIESLSETCVLPTILQRIAAGDKTAVAECLDVYGKLIWSLAGKHERNVHDREDAVQEIFIGIWQSARVFDPSKSPEYAFVTLVAQRRIMSRLRKVYRAPQISALETVLNTCANNFHVKLQCRVEAKFFIDILSNLVPLEKRVLQMFIYDGMTHTEISEKLKIPLGTVKTKIRRRLKKIRRDIDEAEHRAGIKTSFSRV